MLPADPEALLHALALCPAASFHEERVAAVITQFLEERRLPYQVDGYGNIIAHYQRGAAPALATVAHMDHPGFEVVEPGVATLLGGVGREFLHPGTPVRLFSGGLARPSRALREPQDGASGDTSPGRGRSLRPSKGPGGGLPGRITAVRGIPDRLVLFDLETDSALTPGDWGVWEMEDFREDGDVLHLRAADDLAGCTVALATLAALQAEAAEADLRAVFTRAEEVGLVGATLIARGRALPEGTVVISLESSKVLPGVEQGKGPIIRVGDARRTFDASAEALLHAGLEELRHDEPGFKAQRHLMSGGTCEATAFAAFGYAATGIALPLGNYHNMAEDGRLAAEFIHRADLAGAVALLRAAVMAAPSADRSPARRRLQEMAERYQSRLRRPLQT